MLQQPRRGAPILLGCLRHPIDDCDLGLGLGLLELALKLQILLVRGMMPRRDKTRVCGVRKPCPQRARGDARSGACGVAEVAARDDSHDLLAELGGELGLPRPLRQPRPFRADAGVHGGAYRSRLVWHARACACGSSCLALGRLPSPLRLPLGSTFRRRLLGAHRALSRCDSSLRICLAMAFSAMLACSRTGSWRGTWSARKRPAGTPRMSMIRRVVADIAPQQFGLERGNNTMRCIRCYVASTAFSRLLGTHRLAQSRTLAGRLVWARCARVNQGIGLGLRNRELTPERRGRGSSWILAAVRPCPKRSARA